MNILLVGGGLYATAMAWGNLECPQVANRTFSLAPMQLFLWWPVGGVPPLSSLAEVVVTVIDVNNHAPHFLQRLYHTQVEENSSPDAFLLQVRTPGGHRML